MKRWLIPLLPTLLILPLLFTGCSQHEPRRTPRVEDTGYCLRAEQNLERMQCKNRVGNPMWVNQHGERFRDTCKTAQGEGRIFFNPKCIANAKRCTEANQCPVEGMQ